MYLRIFTSDICWYLMILAIDTRLTDHIEFTESLPAPSGTHEGCGLPQSLADKAQICLTLAWPGRTESRPAICRPT